MSAPPWPFRNHVKFSSFEHTHENTTMFGWKGCALCYLLALDSVRLQQPEEIALKKVISRLPVYV